MRISAFAEVGGFEPSLIAGEEPDLCARLRRRGWRVERLDAEMSRHDAALTRFGQWWRRSLRAGHARAEHAARHFFQPGFPGVRECLSNAVWGLILPAVLVLGAPFTRGITLLALVALYGALWLKVARSRRLRGTPPDDANLYAGLTLLGKLPQALGQVHYWRVRCSARPATLIEYKGPSVPASRPRRGVAGPSASTSAIHGHPTAA